MDLGHNHIFPKDYFMNLREVLGLGVILDSRESLEEVCWLVCLFVGGNLVEWWNLGQEATRLLLVQIQEVFMTLFNI